MNLYRPVKVHRVYEAVVEQMSELIREGKLKPGDPFPPERELAESLGVSRTSVREALRVLEFMGLATIRPGEGTFVADMQREGYSRMLLGMAFGTDIIEDLLEIREILEPRIAEMAALKATVEDLCNMDRAIRELESFIESGDTDSVAISVHVAIANACGNAVLAHFMNSVNYLLESTFSRTRSVPGRSAMTVLEHKHIVEAIKKRDPELARQAVLLHMRKIGDALVDLDRPSSEQTP